MDKQDSENQNPDYAVEGVDPEVEAKIDAMMNIDKPKKPASEGKSLKINVTDFEAKTDEQEPEQSGAPLLPNEELPDFESNNKAEEPDNEADVSTEGRAG
jgi:hypothetical protein